MRPESIGQVYDRRPEAELVGALSPDHVCCGHHHYSLPSFRIERSDVHCLNIITTDASAGVIEPGWCGVFEWNGEGLRFLMSWPAQKAIGKEVSRNDLPC